jgi:hypothetical protein
MKITIKIVLLLTIGLFGLAACSKEKKIERSLQRYKGVWEVTNYHGLYYHYFEEDTAFGEYKFDNYAIFRFFNNGNFESIGDNWQTNYEGTWMNTEDELIIMGEDVDYYGTAKVYQITEHSGNQMTLTRTIYKNDIQWFKTIETLQLKRLK